MQVSYHTEPRTGGAVIGAGDYKFKPGYWTSWSRKQTRNEELTFRLFVRDEGFQRNICSAVLGAEKFSTSENDAILAARDLRRSETIAGGKNVVGAKNGLCPAASDLL